MFSRFAGVEFAAELYDFLTEDVVRYVSLLAKKI
jgi:hypothetical protein